MKHANLTPEAQAIADRARGAQAACEQAAIIIEALGATREAYEAIIRSKVGTPKPWAPTAKDKAYDEALERIAFDVLGAIR